MPNFRIALGYKTEHRRSEPVIIASGYDQTALQKAVDSAHTGLQRFEFGTFLFQRSARRSGGVAPSGAVESEESAPRGPSFEEGMGMLARIDELERLLRDEREKVDTLESAVAKEKGALVDEREKVRKLEFALSTVSLKPADILAQGPAALQNSTPTEAGVTAEKLAEPPAPAAAACSVESSAAGGNPPAAADDGGGPQLLPSTAADTKPAASKKSR